MDHATHESKYETKLIVPRQQHEDYLGYIIRIQKLYIFNIWIYTHCGDGKVELLKQAAGFLKDRKHVRILFWEKAGVEHCALIKNIETLLERTKKNNTKCYYCDRRTFWFNSQVKYDNHICCNLFTPEIVCPKKKTYCFINEEKLQKIKKYYNRWYRMLHCRCHNQPP